MKKIIFVVMMIALLSAATASAAIIKYQNTTTRAAGGDAISVYLTGTSTPAPLYQDSSGKLDLPNPVPTSRTGVYWFYVEEGTYDIYATKPGTTTEASIGVSILLPSFHTAGTWTAAQTFVGSVGISTGATITATKFAGNVVSTGTSTFAGIATSGTVTAGKFSGNLVSTGTNTLAGIVTSGTVTAAYFSLSALNTAPSTSVTACTTGMIRIDSSAIYVCVGTNSWKTVAIAAW